MTPRSRSQILANLESLYREAYERARSAGDKTRMADLDSAYQREQLLLEVLLDIRDALAAPPREKERGGAEEAVAALKTIRDITKLR